jgi:hypothetical protein
VRKRPIQVWPGNEKEVNLNLLVANKTLHREASPIFYGQNQFDFAEEAQPNIIACLRETRRNAALMRSIWFEFPRLEASKRYQEVLIHDDDIYFRNRLRKFCPTVRSITIPGDGVDELERDIKKVGGPVTVPGILGMINDSFHAFAPLTEINVMYPLDAVTSESHEHLREEMVKQGWKVEIVERKM